MTGVARAGRVVSLGRLASYWKSIYLNELTDDLTDLIVRHGVQRSSPPCGFGLLFVGS